MNQNANRERLLLITLGAGLVLAPAAFGGMTGWFTDMFALVAGMFAVGCAFTFLVPSDDPDTGMRFLATPACLYILAILWSILQATVPIADSSAHAAWLDAASILEIAVHPVVSLNPEASIAGALRLAGYGIVFFVAYILAVDEAPAIRLLMGIALAGAAYALYGIVLELTNSGYVLWYTRTFEPGNLSSTFPNRNAFATYATLCLLCGCMILYRRRIRLEDTSSGWRRALVAVVRYYFRRNGVALYVTAILFAAILMTHSRAGLATAVIAFAVFAICAARSAVTKRATISGSALIALCAIVLIWMLGGTTADRFNKFQAASTERLEIYGLTISAISERPFLGTGLGTFRDVFPAFRTPNLRARIEYAHNSYLENALEMGLPAAAAFYAALAMIGIMFGRALLKPRVRHPYPALGIAAIVAAFFHSLFDYAMQFPAVAVTLAAILGVAAAQSFNPTAARMTARAENRRS